MSSTQTYRRLYVWEMPVRLYHWLNALAITVLGVTGYLIGRPFTVGYAQEASFQYWFGTVRFLHFMAGYVFLFNMLVRTYWGFVGNRFASWDKFIPLDRQAWRDIVEVLRIDILQTRGTGPIHIGHNRLAGLIYFVTFFIFMFQGLTGFALYGPMSHSVFGNLASWVIPLMGSEAVVRQWHHTMLWFYVLFTLVHVYLVFYHDYVEGRGTTSSMVGGWKFEREDRLDD